MTLRSLTELIIAGGTVADKVSSARSGQPPGDSAADRLTLTSA